MGFNVTISEDLVRSVEQKVSSGEYGLIHEVVEHALRTNEVKEARRPFEAERRALRLHPSLTPGDCRPRGNASGTRP